MQKKKVLLITYGHRDHASSRIRALNHFERLKDVFDTTWIPRTGLHKRSNIFEKLWFTVFKVLLSIKRSLAILLRRYDIVFVQTVFLDKWQLKLLKIKGTLICYDFDDAIYTYSQKSFDIMLEYADKVVISTPYLVEDFASQNKSHKIIYSPVDTDLIFPNNESHEVFTIGWIGSPWTLLHLESINPVFTMLASKIKFKLLLVGAQMQLPGVEIECMDWSEENELIALKKIDVGIMPLDNHTWSPKKGGYKLYLYMAAGKPIIATPVGINGMIVKNGVNGFQANSITVWTEALMQIANNANLSTELGLRARHDAEELYSYNACTGKLFDYLNT